MVNIAGHEAGALGLGLMGLTWRPQQTPDSQAFPLLKRAIAEGCTFWNSGEFYGTPEPTLNLQLLNRYFTKYPEDRSKVFISVKGCVVIEGGFKADSSPAGIRSSVENSCKVLGSYIDLFQAARVDTSTPIEDSMATFKELIAEGKIRSVGLSECGANTIRRAAKVIAIAGVEQEYSLWSTELESNGILAACSELKIPLIAYSPLGRGFLTGQFKQRSDLPENDHRLTFDRFSEENFDKNLQLVQHLEEYASKKGVKASQLAIAWVLAQQSVHDLEILPIPGCTTEARFIENAASTKVRLSSSELEEIQQILSSVQIVGRRYNKHVEGTLFSDSVEQ